MPLKIGNVDFGKIATEGFPAPWMNIAKTISKLTGNSKILNFMSGIEGLTKFLFTPSGFKLGGCEFDGLIRSEHLHKVRPTQFPVQSGVTMTDHAIIEPAELTLELMMSDASTDTKGFLGSLLGFVGGSLFGSSTGYKVTKTINEIYGILKDLPFSNILKKMPDLILEQGEGRSVKAWGTLISLMQSRVPLTVETRLQTYKNMIIEEVSSPDDCTTYYGLKCTVRLREIIFAEVAETETSARAAATAKESTGGEKQVTTDPNKTATKTIVEKYTGAILH